MCGRVRTCLYAHALSSVGSSLDDGPVVLFMWLSRALSPSISHSFILALFLRLSLTPSISLCLSTLCPFYPFTRPTTRLSLNPRTFSIYFALYHFIQWIFFLFPSWWWCLYLRVRAGVAPQRTSVWEMFHSFWADFIWFPHLRRRVATLLDPTAVQSAALYTVKQFRWLDGRGLRRFSGHPNGDPSFPFQSSGSSWMSNEWLLFLVLEWSFLAHREKQLFDNDGPNQRKKQMTNDTPFK